VSKVLVTNAASFMGMHTLAHIVRTTAWDVVAAVNTEHELVTLRYNLIQLGVDGTLSERITPIITDLQHWFTDEQLETLSNTDYVVQLAEEYTTDASASLTRAVYSTYMLLDYTNRYGVQKYLYVGNDTQLAMVQASQQTLVQQYFLHNGTNCLLATTQDLFGELQSQQSPIYELLKTIYTDQSVTLDATQHVRHIEAPGRIYEEKKPTYGTHSYLHVTNAAEAICFILDQRWPDKTQLLIQPLVITGEQAYSDLEIATLLAAALNKELNYTIHDVESVHTPAYTAEKLLKLGWKMPIGFERSVKQKVDFFKKIEKLWIKDL
jgi:nucleoside-diphosphate-sugar epimerase